MASWSELLLEHSRVIANDPNWLNRKLYEQLNKISQHRRSDIVIFYASSFLQKPGIDQSAITREEINGFMNALHGAKGERLTLILHTLGGDPSAVESIVDYLHSKFTYIEVVVPYLAMSCGAMISLASDLLVLGRQSQLGPIDPQLALFNKTHSARSIQEGFNKAKEDIQSNLNLAHLWAPILQNMGPSLFVDAEKALSYSKRLVASWLNKRMLKNMEDEKERKKKADIIAAYFNAEGKPESDKIRVHGQRIGAEKLVDLGVNLEFLEKNQNLQDDVMTAYHLMTLIFESSPCIKFIASDDGKMWAKQQAQPIAPPHLPRQPPPVNP